MINGAAVSALNCYGLRLTSALAVLVAMATAAEFPAVSGWSLTGDGIKPEFGASDRMQFTGQFRLIAPLSNSKGTQIFRIDSTGFSPTKLRLNAFGSGPELLFERGFRLRLGCLSAPRLSWSEGSVDAELPTAPSKWVALSFQDSQPPVLLSFTEPISLLVTGKSGNWQIRASTPEPHKGWVRFALPMGVRALNTSDISALGLLVQTVKQNESFWAEPSPSLKGFEVQQAEGGLTARWVFDRPGAVVPPPALLSWRGGYKVSLESEVQHLDAPRADGPLAYATGPSLSCFFPIRPLAFGRSITTGQGPMQTGISAVEFALRAQLADFRPDSRNWTNLKPFDSLLISHGISSESVVTQVGALAKDRDWRTWRLPNADRGAEAKIALAGALTRQSNSQLQGAMSQAVLASEVGLHAFYGRKISVSDPLSAERDALFGEAGKSPFEPVLRSPYRSLSGPPMRAKLTGKNVTIQISAGTSSVAIQIPGAYTVVSSTLKNLREAISLDGRDHFVLGRPLSQNATTLVIRNPNGIVEPIPVFKPIR